MSPKNLVLIATAVAVLAMGVYLFIQVRATPAQAGHTTSPLPAKPSAARTAQAEAREPPHESEPSVQQKPAWRSPDNIRVGNDAIDPMVPPAPTPVDDTKVNLKMDNLMELANKAYDGQDFDQATAIAGKVLAKDPTNIRMLRIMVSASCIQGDNAIAQQHYEKLPPHDREQMKARCDRYGMTFKDP